MTSLPQSTNSEEHSRQECAALREQLQAAQAEAHALNEELAETNKGVVALYAELEDQATQLRQASELKSRFLSYLSHEFRTPLGSIRSIARILLDRMDGPLNEEQVKQVRFMQNSAVELTEMVDDLLDLAKVEAGRITVSPEWFEMVDLFSALRGMFKPIVSNDAVGLIFEELHGIPSLFTDDQKLSQILRNFISNALKFTLSGEVRVFAHATTEGMVVFGVRDTGIGIPEEALSQMFQEFSQVSSPLQKRHRGTGLGLALSKKLAILLGGDVAVESQVGVGSTFQVTIPARLPGYTENSDESSQSLKHAE